MQGQNSNTTLKPAGQLSVFFRSAKGVMPVTARHGPMRFPRKWVAVWVSLLVIVAAVAPWEHCEIGPPRGGPRMPPDDLPACDYCAIVGCMEDRPEADVWPWRLRDPMPVLPIPLRPPDPDATLNLKAVLDRLYDNGRYANDIDTGPPEPGLSPDDAAWAAQFLPAPGNCPCEPSRVHCWHHYMGA